jgi:hypothetical protein
MEDYRSNDTLFLSRSVLQEAGAQAR